MGRIIDIPFAYGATGVPRRSHNAKDIHVVDVVPVELPEFSFEDLQPVVRVHANDGAPEKTIAACLGGYVCSEPEIGMTLELFQRAVETLPTHMKRRIGYMDHLPGFHAVLGMQRHGETVDFMHADLAGGLRTLISSNEEAVRKEFHEKIVPKLAIVDGCVVQVMDEPVWQATTSHTVGQPAATMRIGFSLDYRPDWLWSFRLDGIDRARAIFGTNDLRLVESIAHVEDLGVVEWKLDEVRAAAATFSKWLMDRLSNPGAGRLFETASADFFRACCVVRDWQTSSNADLIAASQVLFEEVPRLDTKELPLGFLEESARRVVAIAAMQPNPEAEFLGELRI